MSITMLILNAFTVLNIIKILRIFEKVGAHILRKVAFHISVRTRKYETSLSKLGSFYRLTYRKDAVGTQLLHVIRRSIIKTSASIVPYYIFIAVHVSYGIAVVILSGSYLAPCKALSLSC